MTNGEVSTLIPAIKRNIVPELQNMSTSIITGSRSGQAILARRAATDSEDTTTEKRAPVMGE